MEHIKNIINPDNPLHPTYTLMRRKAINGLDVSRPGLLIPLFT